jgi:cyclophilin family peptidyl-prolyl cis-trans isomerase
MTAVTNEKRARHKELRRQKLEQQRKSAKRQQLLRRSGISVGVAVLVLLSGYWIFAGNSTTTSTTSTTSTTMGGNATTSTTSTTTTTPVNLAISQAQADATAVAAGCPKNTTTRVNTLSWGSAPAMAIDTNKTYTANVVTTAGSFAISLDARKAPKTVNSFVFLAQHNYFHCIIFHRAIPGFMVQTGDPTGTGTGGPGYSFADELPTGAYPLYSVNMANSGPNTNGSQFFIVTGASGENLPDSYTRFGQVTSGVATIQTLDAAGNSDPNANGEPPHVTHRILSVTITHN